MAKLRLNRVLLIISGGIAAYKSPEIVRQLRSKGYSVQCLLTSGGARFVTALTLQTVSEKPVYGELFSLTDEDKMGHIKLSRDTDIILVAPASANLIAHMAHGLANDLATTTLLASDKPVIIAPAMNSKMWQNAATQHNLKLLRTRNISILGPDDGNMACGETGIGRMVEPSQIVQNIMNRLNKKKILTGFKALVTSGPTYEPIDVVRFIGNHSSGKQGHAIANALSELGAETTLVTGPTNQPIPEGIKCINVGTAEEMYNACMNSLPTDIVVCAAAVADWRPKKNASIKIKKTNKTSIPKFELTETQDILMSLSRIKNKRPSLIIGFAAESNNILSNAKKKYIKKGCDWLLANDVSKESKVLSGDENQIFFITNKGVDNWPLMSKKQVSDKLALKIAKHFGKSK